jgi:hypothetical protein
MIELSDLDLVRFFLDNFEDVKFIISDKKSKIKEKLKEIKNNEKKLEKYVEKGRFIPKEQQEKTKLMQELWELLLKEAIYCLRFEDEKDENEFKQDFGLIETKKYFKEFSDFEEVLYGSIKYYRDHSLHVIRVFLTGFYLLHNFNDICFSSIIIHGEDKLYESEINEIERHAIWAIIALTHDLGYPLQKIDEINKKIKGIIKYYGTSGIEEFKYTLPLQNQNLNDFILKFISSKLIIEKNNKTIEKEHFKYFTVIQNKYYLKFAKAFEGFSHGIMSCILLMKHLVYFKESDYTHDIFNGFSNERDAKQFLIRKAILRSIASHDNDDIYHIHPNTFLFILTFCDELQEWDRPFKEIRFEETNKIEIRNFQMNKISYNKKSYTNPLELNNQILENYSRTIKKYIKLFRSGPDSHKRRFTFIFTLTIYNGENSLELIEFRYPPKEKPQIINLLNQKDYIDLILEYIENDYKEFVEFNSFIEEINQGIKKS